MVRGFMNLSGRRPKSYIHLDGFNTLIRYYGTRHINLGSITLENERDHNPSVFGHVAIDCFSLEFDANGDKIPYYQFDVRYHVFPIERDSNIYKRNTTLRWLIDDFTALALSPTGVIDYQVAQLNGIQSMKIAFRQVKLMLQTHKRLAPYRDRILEIHSGLYTCRCKPQFNARSDVNIMFNNQSYHFFDEADMKYIKQEEERWAVCQSLTSMSSQSMCSSSSTSSVPF